MEHQERQKFWETLEATFVDMSREEDAVLNYPWLTYGSDDLSGPFKVSLTLQT